MNTITICPRCQQVCNSRRHDCQREQKRDAERDREGLEANSLAVALSDWMVIVDALSQLTTMCRRPAKPVARPAATPAPQPA